MCVYKGPYVEIFAQGEEKCVKDFLEKLENQPPKMSCHIEDQYRRCKRGRIREFE